jgi:hypothetical protein
MYVLLKTNLFPNSLIMKKHYVETTKKVIGFCMLSYFLFFAIPNLQAEEVQCGSSGYTIELTSVEYANGNTTFTYQVKGDGSAQFALSHWVVEFCPGNCDYIVSAGPGTVSCGLDPTTGTYGLKFDTGLAADANQTYSITLKGYWETDDTKAVIKAGQNEIFCDITGPACEPGATAPSCDATGDVLDCYGLENGVVSVIWGGGIGPFTVELFDNNDAENPVLLVKRENVESPEDFTGLAAGKYLVKVTDATNEFSTCPAEITQPDELVLTLTPTDLLCYEDESGKIVASWVGGTGPFSIYLDGVLQSSAAVSPYEITGLDALVEYTIKVVDANECYDEEKEELTQPDELVLTLTPTDLLCYEDESGKIVASWVGGTGPFSIYLDGVLQSSAAVSPYEITGLDALVEYTIKVIDANECYDEEKEELNQPTELTCTVTQDSQASCDASVGGSATVYPVGGTPFDVGDPYLFSWKNSSNVEVGTTASVSDLAPGDYVVTVTDANGCTTTCEVTITREPEVFVCETAFARGEVNTCFLPKFDRWGWTNLISQTESYYEYTMPLWSGAAQCETDKGTHVGNAIVTYYEGIVTVKYVMFEGFVLQEAHVYVGYDPYPVVKKGKTTEETVAPGQYNYNSGPLDNVDGLTEIVFEGLNGNAVYIIIHGVACEAVCMYEEPETMEVNFYQNFSTTKKSASIDVLDVNGNSLKAYPNPFSSEVTFEFAAGKDARALLEITNIAGQRIATLMDRHVHQGVVNSVRFSPDNVAEGVLIYRLILGDEVQTGRLIYRK